MGNAQVPRTEEPWVLLGEFKDLVHQDNLGSYKLFKVMKCRHEREQLVLAKLFILREGAPDLQELKRRVLQVKETFKSFWLYPNVVPYQALEVGAQSAVLLRPLFPKNLYERIHSRPFLTDSAKNWIAFQVICAVCQAHSAGVFHGDLKTENVFVSSWNHAILTDFATFKPLVLPKDDPSEFSFYFESNLNRRRCYLAPERLGELSTSVTCAGLRASELAAMDVFSMGCVIAELYLDGATLLDLPELLQYRSGQLDIRAKIACIKNPAVQDMIGSMLEKDPTRRKPADQYLREWCLRVAPRSFRSCLFPLSVLLLHPVYQQPDMRIALIRYNFAGLLWSCIGPARIAKALGVDGGADADIIWARWLAHAEAHVQPADPASMHGMVQAAAQAAAQRAEVVDAGAGGPAGEAERAEASSAPSRAAAAVPPRTLAPPLAQPWLREVCCEGFMESILGFWEDGSRRWRASDSADNAGVDLSAAQASYAAFLRELCTGGGEQRPEGSVPGPPSADRRRSDCAGAGSAAEAIQAAMFGLSEAEQAPEQDLPEIVPDASASEDVLGVLCGIICSPLQHLSNPRLRTICLDMLEQMAAFATTDVILEQIVPFGHMLMKDPVARVRARAISALVGILSNVKELPLGDAPLFVDYLLPQLLSAMADMSGEPVVLLAVAQNIGQLTRHALRFAELSVAAARRGAAQAAAGTGEGDDRESSGGSPARPDAPVPRPTATGSAAAAAASFDAQWKLVREAVQKVVKKLMECMPAGPMPMPGGSPKNAGGEGGGGGASDEPLLDVASGREMKKSLLRNMCALAESFGKEDTHSFLLPYLITFMNDPAWEVRAAFCEEVALLPRKVGHVSTEGIVWPCYVEALQDQEERVLAAALKGLVVFVGQHVLRRQCLESVASKVAPFLVHPSALIRRRAVKVLEAVGGELSAVDQFVFILPIVRPFLRFEVLGLDGLEGALVPPLCRRKFKRVLLKREEAIHEALLHKMPLPPCDEAGEADSDEGDGVQQATDRAALELMRPALHLMVRSRPTIAQMTNTMGAGVTDERALNVDPTLVKCLLYHAVNPYRAPHRSLQALAEAEGCPGESAWCYAAVQKLRSSSGHPLDIFSMPAFLTQALCLPPHPRDLGMLTHLDGSPYSIYAMRADGEEEARLHAHAAVHDMLGLRESRQGVQELDDSREALGSSTFSDRAGAATSQSWSISPESALGAAGSAEERGRARTAWRPQGALLATLYEYAHQSGVPVVKVDTTDDSRVLVTGGKDGVVKIWNSAMLERDVAVSSQQTFVVPAGGNRERAQLRTLRTVRDSKAVAVGSEAGDVLLYRIDSRGGTACPEVCRLATPTEGSPAGAGGRAVMCIEQFDTDLESVVVFAREDGTVQGWDLRMDRASWSLRQVPPWLGVPSCMALGGDGHSMVVGTLGGGLLSYDLRFLAPWKQWKLSSGAAVLSMKSAQFRPSPSVFVAMGSDSNEVALFDVVGGSCLTLFCTEPAAERSSEATPVVPQLMPIETKLYGSPPPESFRATASIGKRGSSSVRALWLPPRGEQTCLLAGSTDRKVRHWSLDPERHTAEAYVVTPPDPAAQAERAQERPTYRSCMQEDVFVVQEQAAVRAEAGPWGTLSSSGLPGDGDEPRSARSLGPNPNHRDSILDMCTISLSSNLLVTAGRDGLVKLWR